MFSLFLKYGFSSLLCSVYLLTLLLSAGQISQFCRTSLLLFDHKLILLNMQRIPLSDTNEFIPDSTGPLDFRVLHILSGWLSQEVLITDFQDSLM